MRCKEENGYAAIVALTVIVLLTIIGTNLLQVTLSSLVQARKTETRSEAEYRARMGMEEALARIKKAVEAGNEQIKAKQGMLPTDSAYGIQTVDLKSVNDAYAYAFSELESHSFHELEDSYRIRITREPTKAETEKKQIEAFVAKLVVESTGEAPSANGYVDKSTLKATIYVTSLPEEFYYVLSTPDEALSQIALNGAPYIEGDVYSHAYSMSKTANYYLNVSSDSTAFDQKHQETTYPSIIGQASVPHNDNLLGLFQRDGSAFVKKESIDEKKNIIGEWNNSFVLPPTLQFNATPNFGYIAPIKDVFKNMKKKVEPFLTPASEIPDTSDYENIDAIQYQGPTDTLLAAGQTDRKSVSINMNHRVISNGDYTIQGELTTADSSELRITNGNLVIGGNTTPLESASGSTAAAILRGKISLLDSTGKRNQDAFIFVNGNAILEDLAFDGNIYVNGDLYVQKNFQINGTVYVAKNVYFTEEGASAEKLNTGNTLVLLAQGTVEAYNLNLYDYDNDTPKAKELNVFIVSQAPAGVTLYGVGSNVRFIGGIHAQKIELNAVRGKVKPLKKDNPSEPDFIDPLNSDPKASRLSVLYADNIFENTPPGIPIIHHLSYHIQNMAFETK